jgi:hypothetical protein
MATHEKFGNETVRRITEKWTTADNYQVKVYTYHDKRKKVYWSVILECIIEPSGDSGYYSEKHDPHSDLNRLISQKLATRYNYEKMSAAHELAVAEVGSLVASLLAAHEKDVA